MMVPSARTPGGARWEGSHAETERAPAAQWIAFAERLNATRGHENAGFLSLDRGFLPRSDPRLQLARSHSAWDEVASLLPEFYEHGLVRRRIDELPLLSGSEADLANEDVIRAAALLAFLSHAYWYCLPTPVSALPEVLARPWRQVRERLGRDHEVITYIDLIVYNWRRKDPSGPLEVSNLSLLFPTIGNQEEQVFYLTQLEILARSTDLVLAIVSAQSAALCEDGRRLEQELGELSRGLERIVRVALPKISGQSRHPHFVDAVTWAKTVAPFAVPFRAGIQGPSGTSSPIFNTLDVFFGRRQYSSFLGREIRDLRGTYPRLWRGFLRRVARVDVAASVRKLESPALSEAWDRATEAYAGGDGFLGRHRMKVYGFLELAFKVGRAITIGGFGGAFQDRTWDEVDDELESSRAERPNKQERPSGRVPTQRAPLFEGAAHARYYFSDVARHNSSEHGYWVVLSSSVYDLTHFRARHPGGERILDAYAGMDATHGFERAHRGRPNVEKMLAPLRIGELAEPALDEKRRLVAVSGRAEMELSEKLLYRAHVRALNLCVEMQNALVIDLSFADRAVHPQAKDSELSPYKIVRLAEAHERFLTSELGVLVRETFPRLAELALAWVDPSAEVSSGRTECALFDAEIRRARGRVQEVTHACEEKSLNAADAREVLATAAADTELLAALKGLLIETLEAFEAELDERGRVLLEIHRRIEELLVHRRVLG